jgi:hypothetical protein
MAELSQLNVLVTFWLSFQMALDTILASKSIVLPVIC